MDDWLVTVILVGTCVGGLIPIVGIIGFFIRRMKEDAYTARLKQLMIERGFNVDDIERIIRATPPTDSDRDWKHINEFMGRDRKAG